mmetsp:Transcript_5250/g.15269  ORF Transcript_5250/g.15269 Transcript_5250/m.15269 type:complete len:86 (-) Transcript_5250:334-591(-)
MATQRVAGAASSSLAHICPFLTQVLDRMELTDLPNFRATEKVTAFHRIVINKFCCFHFIDERESNVLGSHVIHFTMIKKSTNTSS